MSDKFCVMHLKYLNCVSLQIVKSSFVIESPVFNHEWNCLSIKDDGNAAKLAKPCTENLSLSEKEIERILGPQTFTGIPCELDSMEIFGEKYFCILILSNKVSLFEYQLSVFRKQS